jgi:TPR repeat protein
MYALGHGVPEDYAEAVKWHRKAAEQGLAEAQSHLGYMYAMGQGVPQNNVGLRLAQYRHCSRP